MIKRLVGKGNLTTILFVIGTWLSFRTAAIALMGDRLQLSDVGFYITVIIGMCIVLFDELWTSPRTHKMFEAEHVRDVADGGGGLGRSV